MFEADLFMFFRFWLGWVVTVYATIITAQSLWGWYVWLRGNDKYMTLLRRYLVVHGLRMRFRAFWGDVLVCVLLCIAFLLIWRAQILMDEVRRTASESRQIAVHPRAHVQQSR
jgi:hypothetical protein